MEGTKRKWYTLYDQLFVITNLENAWKKIKRSKGAGGVDKVTIGQYEKNLEINLQELHRAGNPHVRLGEGLEKVIFLAYSI